MSKFRIPTFRKRPIAAYAQSPNSLPAALETGRGNAPSTRMKNQTSMYSRFSRIGICDGNIRQRTIAMTEAERTGKIRLPEAAV